VITAGLVIAAALIMRVPANYLLFGYPALALILFLVAFALGTSLVVSSLLNDRRTKPKEERDPI
jgi:ubiquinone biosynthesis protein